MAAVELKWFLALFEVVRAVARVEHLARERLNRGGRQHRGQLCQMRAAFNSRQALFDAIAKSFEEIQADELFISRTDRIAVVRIGDSVRDGLCVDDIELSVDGDAQPEIMQRLACWSDTGGEPGITSLDIRYMRVDIPQAVVASERFDLDCARVL